MKNLTTTLLLLLCLSTALSAQSVTKGKLIGKWRATAMETKGKTFSIGSEESIMHFFLSSAEHNIGKEDSAMLRQVSKMIYGVLGSVRFDFHANDSIYAKITISMDDETKTETDVMHYTISGSTLIMTNPGSKTEEIIVSMPDTRTLVMENFSAARGSRLIFTRQ